MSPVMCHMSYYFFLSDQVVELIVGASVINGAYPVQLLSSRFAKLPSQAIDWKIWKALYLHGWLVCWLLGWLLSHFGLSVRGQLVSRSVSTD